MTQQWRRLEDPEETERWEADKRPPAAVTGHLLYTEEDVELVARVLREVDVRLAINDADVWYVERARSILAALSSANRLVPPGSEVREEWGNRYAWTNSDHTEEYKARDQRDAEATVQFHERERATNPNWTGSTSVLRRLHIVTPWSPSVPDTEEGT